MAFWVNGMWALWNCYFAYYVVRHSLAMQQERDDHRFVDQLSITIEEADGSKRPILHGILTDLNPAGMGFRATRRFEPGTKLAFELPLSTGDVSVTGEVRHAGVDELNGGVAFDHGVSFDALPFETKDAIE